MEASGIAEPRALIRMVARVADPAVRYGGLVYVLDAVAAAGTHMRHPEIGGHVAIADLVVINKADLADDRTLAGVLAMVGDLNPTAPRIVTTEGRIDCEALFDLSDRPEPADDLPRQLTLDELLRADDRGAGSMVTTHLHDAFDSVSVQVVGLIDPRRLAAMLERPPPGATGSRAWCGRPVRPSSSRCMPSAGSCVPSGPESGGYPPRP